MESFIAVSLILVPTFKVLQYVFVYMSTNFVVFMDLWSDLKPENLLFRGPEDDSDLLIADFGLSKVIDDTKFNALTTTCGTPGWNSSHRLSKSA